jgi:hypothetical protein
MTSTVPSVKDIGPGRLASKVKVNALARGLFAKINRIGVISVRCTQFPIHRFFAHETPFFFIDLVFGYTINSDMWVGDSPGSRQGRARSGSARQGFVAEWGS